MPLGVKIEKPETLMGKLQRGHGAGYIEALKTSSEKVRPLLIECICNDPRWDSQVEFRSEYYASLIIKTGTAIPPLEEHLKENDDTDQHGRNTTLTIETLCSLALRKHDQAAKILCDYLSYGNWWNWVVPQLLETKEDGYIDIISEILCLRFEDDDELHEELGSLDLSNIESLGKSNQRIAHVAVRIRELRHPDDRQKYAKLNYTAMSLIELFDICNQHNYMKLSKVLESRVSIKDVSFLNSMIGSDRNLRTYLAIRALGAIRSTESFDCLRQFIDNNCEKSGYVFSQALNCIANISSDICLNTGRKWFLSDKFLQQKAGENILKEHATTEDIPLLRKTINESLKNGDIYRICCAIDALANFPDRGIIPEVEQTYHDVVYSYARWRTARTMQINAPTEFSSKYAYECLYDCEDKTKLIGMESINKNDQAATQRIKELAEDPYQDKDIRNRADEINQRC